jgi:hypothetical protein
MNTITVQEVVDFAIKQEQAEQLKKLLKARVEEAKDRSNLIPAEPIIKAMLAKYAH